MFFQTVRRSLISEPVGNNMTNREEDVLRVKNRLSAHGRYDLASAAEPHGILTRALDESIRTFQRDKNLKVDGILKPGGETEGVLLGRRAKDAQKTSASKPPPKPVSPLRLSSSVGNNQQNNPDDLHAVQRGLAALGFLAIEDADNATGIIDRPTDTAIRGFQQDRGLRIDGILHPGGETEQAVNGLIDRVAIPEPAADDDGDEGGGEGGEGDEESPPPPSDEENPEDPDCSDLEVALEEAQAELEEAQAEYDRIEDEYQEAVTTLEDLREELRKLEEGKCVEEKKAVEDTEKKKVEKEAEINALQAEIERLKERLNHSAAGVGSGVINAIGGRALGRLGKSATGIAKITISAAELVKIKAALNAAEKRLKEAEVELAHIQQKADQAKINLKLCEKNSKE